MNSFLHIVLFEMKYIFSRVSVWMYGLFFFLLAFFVMAGAAGIFGEGTFSVMETVNSPLNIFSHLIFFNKLLLFLLLAVLGAALYRDVKDNTHSLLYSYPIGKKEYLAGKFFGSFIVVLVLSFSVGMGLAFGASIPGIQKNIVVPFDIAIYTQIYAVYIIPNLFFFACLIFTATLLTRNPYAGAVLLLLVFILRECVVRFLRNSTLGLLLEPFGESITRSFITHLTLAERSTASLPYETAIQLNRLMWLLIGCVTLFLAYRRFSFTQNFEPFFKFLKKNLYIPKKDALEAVVSGLPSSDLSFSWHANFKKTIALAGVDFVHTIRSRIFIGISILLCGFALALTLQLNPIFETRILPTTWFIMSYPMFFFSLITPFISFLYAGILICKPEISRMSDLIDLTPIPDWVLIISRIWVLMGIQISLLLQITFIGVTVQFFVDVTPIQYGHYFFDIVFIHFLNALGWIFTAVFAYSIFAKFYEGFFTLVAVYLGITLLPNLGIEHAVFRFNASPVDGFYLQYSDLSGYGHALKPHLIYRIYWLLISFVIFLMTLFVWKRGRHFSVKERIIGVRSRVKRINPLLYSTFIMLSVGMGYSLYRNTSFTPQNQNDFSFNRLIQPRIVSIYTSVEFFPESKSFSATGVYTLVNKSAYSIDTLILRRSREVLTSYTIHSSHRWIGHDSLTGLDHLLLSKPMNTGDSVRIYFTINDIPNTALDRNSPIESNGIYLTSLIYPGIGYDDQNRLYHPSDSLASKNHYRSSDADLIDFETIVGTSIDHYVITSGVLLKQWTEKGRQYFHYRSPSPVTSDFAFVSGKYAKYQERSRDVAFEIYHHPEHHYNIRHMVHGLKQTLAYCESNFSSYPYPYIRIAEFARTYGHYAQSFPGLIPWSESGFIIDNSAVNAASLNLSFIGASHEFAHQWWGLQLTPSHALGARMMTESMAEYISLKVLEHEYGKPQARVFLKKALDLYLKKRTDEPGQEKPLAYHEGLSQSYIGYQKGVLVLNAVCEYIGEERLNSALQKFFISSKTQIAPYPNSLQMIEYIRMATPDSLHYLISDLFEKITFYQNEMITANTVEIENGKFRVDFEFSITKNYVDETGTRIYTDKKGNTLKEATHGNSFKTSVPITDYLEIGIFDGHPAGSHQVLYLKKHLLTQINNKLSVVVDRKPSFVGIDPYNILIDTLPQNNVIAIR